MGVKWDITINSAFQNIVFVIVLRVYIFLQIRMDCEEAGIQTKYINGQTQETLKCIERRVNMNSLSF